MDPLWLSCIAILVVILGVLVARLHPFLALVFGALLVAILTPSTQLHQAAIKSSAAIVGEMEGDRIRFSSGQPSSGLHLVYRSGDSGLLESVGEIQLPSADADANGGYRFDGATSPLSVGDFVLHEAAAKSAGKAAAAGPGQRLAFGFGDTCRKIGILIAMASIIGMCLLESGAAQRIVEWTRNVVGEKRTPIAFAISGFIVGIPVFFDTVFYLLMPLAKAMRLKTGGNYLLYVMSIVVGATMAHSLVPPTPGPLLVAAEIEGVSVGHMIVGGLVVGMITVTSGFLFAVWANRVWEIPLRDETGTVVENIETPTDERTLPPIFLSLLPIGLPVVLLAGKTMVDSFSTSEQGWMTTVRPAIEFFGDKNIALVCAAIIALGLLAWQRQKQGREWFAGMQQALSSGGVIILITSAGGAFGQALRQCGIAEAIQARFPDTQSGLTLLMVAFVITVAVRFAQGSATVAMITSVSIVGPLASTMTLGFHPVYLALAIGCGSKPLPWMNDSGFWIVGRMSGMTESETLKIHSTTLTLMGVVGFAATMAGAAWLPFSN